MDSSRSRRRMFPRISGVALLVTTLALLVGCAVPLPWVPAYSSSSSSIRSRPGPIPYNWTRVTPPPPTPQQAFTAGISQLRLCISSTIPARSVTEIWLTAGPTYGVVLLLADCSNQPDDTRQGIAILPIALDHAGHPTCSAWVLGNGGLITRQLPADANLGDMAYVIPSWLPLPRDTYDPEQVGGGMVPSALFSLESSTRLFITGRYAGSVTRPDGAETVSVGGRTGWQVTDHNITTVTISLADGWTFFFSGTADATTMQRLASASLSHLDSLLPKPLPAPTDYPQPTPAC
jgi:hypothetical protein